MDSVRQSATLIVILSPGYLASSWCGREKDAFLSLVRQRGNKQVFVVERDLVNENQRPEELKDLKGFRFWVQEREGKAPRILGSPRPDPSDQEYYNKVDDLCKEIDEELRELQVNSGMPKQPSSSPDKSRLQAVVDTPTVFLAQVTDDLEPERDNVKRYLNQIEVRVVPDTWYSQEANAFKKAVGRDLEQSELFVQLLSSTAGKKPPDLQQGYTRLQFELAHSTGKPILQWRSFELDVSTVQDQDHRTLLEEVTTRAEGLEDFKQEIQKRLFEKPEPLPEKRTNAFVFVDMESADRPLAEQVCAVLDQCGADYVLPFQSDDPAENRRDLEENLLSCDAVIVIYGSTTATWVRRRLLECRKSLARREQPLDALAVFEGPPEEKEQIDMKLHNMRVLDCRKGLHEVDLKGFIGSILSKHML